MAIEAEHRATAQFPPEGMKTERVVLRPAGSQYTGALLIYRLANRAHSTTGNRCEKTPSSPCQPRMNAWR